MPANFYKTANVESSEALMKKTHSSDINDSKRQDTKLTDHIKNDSIQIFKETEVVDSSWMMSVFYNWERLNYDWTINESDS